MPTRASGTLFRSLSQALFAGLKLNPPLPSYYTYPQDKFITAFGSEVAGESLDSGNVETFRSGKRGGLTYYSYELKNLTRPKST